MTCQQCSWEEVKVGGINSHISKLIHLLGGYNFPNTARLWTYLTSVIANIKLDGDIPDTCQVCKSLFHINVITDNKTFKTENDFKYFNLPRGNNLAAEE